MANQPTWMGMAGAYEKNPGWYRSPQVGGGLQYNPQWGYQRRQDIEKGMSSGKPMDQWGLKANTGQDWRTLFPGARTDAELKQMGLYNKATGNNAWQNYKTAGGWFDYGARPGQLGAQPGHPGGTQTLPPGSPFGQLPGQGGLPTQGQVGLTPTPGGVPTIGTLPGQGGNMSPSIQPVGSPYGTGQQPQYPPMGYGQYPGYGQYGQGYGGYPMPQPQYPGAGQWGTGYGQGYGYGGYPGQQNPIPQGFGMQGQGQQGYGWPNWGQWGQGNQWR